MNNTKNQAKRNRSSKGKCSTEPKENEKGYVKSIEKGEKVKKVVKKGIEKGEKLVEKGEKLVEKIKSRLSGNTNKQNPCMHLLEQYEKSRKNLFDLCGNEWVVNHFLIPEIAPLCSKSESLTDEMRSNLCKEILERSHQYISPYDGKLTAEAKRKQYDEYNYCCKEISKNDKIANDTTRMRYAVDFVNYMISEANKFADLRIKLIGKLNSHASWENFLSVLTDCSEFSVCYREDIDSSDSKYYQDYIGGYGDTPYPAIYYRERLIAKGGTA